MIKKGGSVPKIAAVVLLFHPSEEVLSHIESYREHVDRLYVIDNTDEADLSASMREKLLTLPHVTLIHQYENIGVAKALNLALNAAEKEGFTWLLTMDQDSWFDAKVLADYLAHFIVCEKDASLGLFSPLHNAKFVDHSLKIPCTKVETVLSSGNLVSVKAALEAGGYDEALFIDEVDHAFCFSLQKHGYAVYMDHTVYVNHMLGTPFGTYGNIKLYASERLYYMLRNYLYLKENYADSFPEFFHKRDRYLVTFFMKQLLFGKERIKNISMLKKGYSDYKRGIYGKYHA